MRICIASEGHSVNYLVLLSVRLNNLKSAIHYRAPSFNNNANFVTVLFRWAKASKDCENIVPVYIILSHNTPINVQYETSTQTQCSNLWLLVSLTVSLIFSISRVVRCYTTTASLHALWGVSPFLHNINVD